VFLEEKTPAYQTGEFYDGRLNEKNRHAQTIIQNQAGSSKAGPT
jgi:hypothetical protein